MGVEEPHQLTRVGGGGALVVVHHLVEEPGEGVDESVLVGHGRSLAGRADNPRPVFHRPPVPAAPSPFPTHL